MHSCSEECMKYPMQKRILNVSIWMSQEFCNILVCAGFHRHACQIWQLCIKLVVD